MTHLREIDQLRQIKHSIRGSDDCLIVGIDIAKNVHHAFFGNGKGKAFLRDFSFHNDFKGVTRFLEKTNAILKRNKLKRVVFGLEPTANYHKPLADFLIQKGYTVVLVSTVAIRRNRELLDGRWDKNDKKDCANVADLISQGKCLYYDNPSSFIKAIRTLLSLKTRLRKQEHGLRMRIRGQVIANYFPEMDDFFPLIEDECLGVLYSFLNTREIAQLDFYSFYSYVASRPKGYLHQSRVRSVWELAKHSIGRHPTSAAQFEACVLVDSLRSVRALLGRIEKELETERKQSPGYPCLLSIPGFGPAISTVVLGAIGDPHRFENGRQVLKLAGLDLSASRSGKSSLNAKAKISKKGKADLRLALFQAATIASGRSTLFKKWFAEKIEKRKSEKGIKTKIRVKLSAKMLVIAWTLMKREEMFNPSHIEDDLNIF